MNTKKITYGGLIICLSILLPQALHIMMGAPAGKTLLPMHIPVLLGGFILGPSFGLFIGIVSPLFSAFLTGMPAMDRLPFMVIELGIYGFVAGAMFHTLKLRNKSFVGTYISLVTAMVAGRIAYGIALFVATYVFNIPCGGVIAVVTATTVGIYGIIIQLIIIPPIIYALERSGFIEKHIGIKRDAA